MNAVAATEAAGTRHTCSGQSVNLISDSPYAWARMTAIFRSAAGDMRPTSAWPVKFERDDPLHVASLCATRCTPAGTFSFPRARCDQVHLHERRMELARRASRAAR